MHNLFIGFLLLSMVIIVTMGDYMDDKNKLALYGYGIVFTCISSALWLSINFLIFLSQQ